MLISRGVNLLQHVSKHGKRKNMLTNTQFTRLSHIWGYRPVPNPPKIWVISADLAGAFIYWWLFYRMYYDHDDITGHWEYPDVSKWTDEELGIPRDDSD